MTSAEVQQIISDGKNSYKVEFNWKLFGYGNKVSN